MSKHWFEGLWTVKHFRQGKLLWEETKRNSITDQGEEAILETFFRADSNFIPSGFYARLCNDSLLITDTLATVQDEPVGNGYAPQAVERSLVGFPSKQLISNNYQLTSKELTFTASGGDIGPVNTVFLATSSDNTGKLLAFLSLSLPRTIIGSTNDSAVMQFKVRFNA